MAPPPRKMIQCVAPYDLPIESIEIKKFSGDQERVEIDAIIEGELYTFAILPGEMMDMLKDRAEERRAAH